ncbi:MAG: L-threonylcarbamoyladenylate synthase [Microcoleaceae cyanobacterium]
MKGSINELVTAAISGQTVISFPTDTVPALAVRPDKAALIFEVKQRSQDKPLILMGATPDSLWPYVMGMDQERNIWQQVAEQYWPGALTLVLPASEKVSHAMNPTNPTTLGIRVPDSTIAQEILRQTGPLATTSANLSGYPPLLSLTEIDQQFPMVLTLASVQSSSNTTPSAIPSTVVQWHDDRWNILRQGAVKLEFEA